MVVVHHLNNSRSQRILWLLEELGVAYEVKRYERDRNTLLAPPAFTQVHPLGKAPVITDDGVTLAESGAIVDYLVVKYGRGRLSPGHDSPDRVRYIYWLHYAEGSAMTPLLVKLIFDRIEQSPMPFFARPIARGIVGKVRGAYIAPRLKLHLDFLEGELGRSLWFAGEVFTAADIMMSFPLELAVNRAGLDASRPNLAAFLERIHARPAYRKAIERGGQYDLNF